MTVAEFLMEAHRRGLVLKAGPGGLEYDGLESVVTERVLAFMRGHRGELLKLLRAEVAGILTCALCPAPCFTFTRHGDPRCETHTRTAGRCPACYSLAHALPGPGCDVRVVATRKEVTA